MDIDTAPPSMHLDLPTDEVMMEVDDFPAATSIAPPATTPVVVRVMEGGSVAGVRSVPTPPAVQISTSDAPSCPKVKLDEFFVRFIAGQDNHNFLTVLLDDARAGKDISNTPAYRRLQHAAHQGPAGLQPPGSPVSRLINAHTPFGEMSPRSPGLSSPSARGGIAPAPLTSDLDLGRVSSAVSATDTVPIQSPLSTRNLSLTASPESPSTPVDAIKEGKDRAKTEDASVAPLATADSAEQPLNKIAPTTSPATIDTDMVSDSTVHSKPVKVETSGDETMVSSVPNGVAEAPAAVTDESPISVSTTELEKSPVSTSPAGQRKLDVSSPAKQESTTQSISAAGMAPEVDAVAKKDEQVVQANKAVVVPDVIADIQSVDSDTKMEPRDEPSTPLSRPPLQSSADAQMSEESIPKFYFPIGRDAEDREKRELETIRAFFHAQRTQKKMDGATKADIAELLVEVVGVPSYFASLIFTRIAEHYPCNALPTPEPMSSDAAPTPEPMSDTTMKDTSANGDSPATGVAAPNAGGATQAQQQQQQSEGAAAVGAANPVSQNGVAGANGAVPQPVTQTEIIREEQFRAFYEQDCAGRAKEERLFRALLEPGNNRDYLIPADFKPLLRALLICHQGLAFLHATPEFQHRYSETVIERIYFGCTRRHNGRLTLNDIKRSRLLETLMVVDEEEDINRERKYFSYEHFYVLYCRFWELDTNHDLQIDREDLMRYGGHSLTFRIVDRIFGGHARPLDSPDNAGFMSYTDFIWFCLSEEDKTSETAIDYWFRCVDLDGDGLITMYDMEFFYQEQLHRMECFGHEPVQIRDILCQLLDMIKPNAKPPVIRRRDLKKCKLAGNFFNILFNLNKFFALEARDPLQIRQEHATPELTDWDRFAALEYLRLSAEEEGDEDEDWNDVADNAAPLMAGEAPF